MEKETLIYCPLDDSRVIWNEAYQVFNCKQSYHQVQVTIDQDAGSIKIEAH